METIERQYPLTQPPESFELLQRILKARGQSGSERLMFLTYQIGSIPVQALFNPHDNSYFDTGHQEVFPGGATVFDGIATLAGTLHVHMGATDTSPAYVTFTPQAAADQRWT